MFSTDWQPWLGSTSSPLSPSRELNCSQVLAHWVSSKKVGNLLSVECGLQPVNISVCVILSERWEHSERSQLPKGLDETTGENVTKYYPYAQHFKLVSLRQSDQHSIHLQPVQEVNSASHRFRDLKKKLSPSWCSSVDWTWAANQRISGSIPSQGAYQPCGPGPRCGGPTWEATSHWLVLIRKKEKLKVENLFFFKTITK